MVRGLWLLVGACAIGLASASAEVASHDEAAVSVVAMADTERALQEVQDDPEVVPFLPKEQRLDPQWKRVWFSMTEAQRRDARRAFRRELRKPHCLDLDFQESRFRVKAIDENTIAMRIRIVTQGIDAGYTGCIPIQWKAYNGDQSNDWLIQDYKSEVTQVCHDDGYRARFKYRHNQNRRKIIIRFFYECDCYLENGDRCVGHGDETYQHYHTWQVMRENLYKTFMNE